MFEILVSIFIIYLMIVLLPVFIGCVAVAAITFIAGLTWLKDKLLNK